MSAGPNDKAEHELTPVDDVRVVRNGLDEEFGGDLRKVAAHSRAVAERLRVELDLKVVPLPPIRRTATPD